MRVPRQTSSAGVLFATLVLLVSAWAGVLPTRALAEACAGAGAGPCPYTQAQIVGHRAEGVLRLPEAVAVEDTAAVAPGQGSVYVADQLSYVVQKFSSSGSFETEWGSYGGAPGQFGPIGGLATNAAGNVYVVDSSHDRIEKFDSEGEFITSWGHGGSGLGQFHFGSSQNPSEPPGGGIAVAGNYVYVADTGNDRIQRFNLEGGEAFQWGSSGSGPGQFSYPRGLAANASEVIVADDDNHRIEKFDPSGGFQGAAGSKGKGPGQFRFPYGVALDVAGNVYVADNNNYRVDKLSPELSFLGSWGGQGSKPGQFVYPRALASDPGGDTYVADTANDRVEVFDPAGNYLRTIGAPASPLGVVTAPVGLATDPTGGLLVSDTVGNRIEAFSPALGGFTSAWATAGRDSKGLGRPAGIAVDPRGPVYVIDQGNTRVAKFWGDGTFLSELAGGPAPGGLQLHEPYSVAVAPATGDVYVTDTGANRVLVYGTEGSLLAKWGAGGGDGAAGSGPGEFDHPAAVALAPAGPAQGNVYVADEGNNRVVELSPAGAVLGEWGSSGSGSGRFHAPRGVAVDGAGRVYVVDSENDRVQVFDPGGLFLGKWGASGISPGDFSRPTAVAVDCEGNVYVADTSNNRVERFTPLSPASTGCLAPGAWPPPLNVAPMVHVSLLRSGGILAQHALALSIRCQRRCKVLVTATLSPRGNQTGVRLIAAARSLRASRSGRVRLVVGPGALRSLGTALGRQTAMTAHVRIVAAGPTGRRTTVSQTYAVSR
jgi:DNA-binding beta-propeller fold protein YncE